MSAGDITRLLGIDLPVIQAPMAGATTPEMVIAASKAGGLGSLPSAMYSVAELLAAIETIRAATDRPYNINFFTHVPPAPDLDRQAQWRATLAPYHVEFGLDPAAPLKTSNRAPFDDQFCAVVEAHRPKVVSFHFGLPEEALLNRVRRTGARVIASATTVAEALWLEARGVDAVIAMGLEAGGHRGNFLSEDMDTQVGTFSLVPQVVDAVKVPVIAAGGIAERRGVEAAFVLGASAVQVGTAYLFTPEAKVSALHRAALRSVADDGTALTNLFTGRPARGIMNRLMRDLGPMNPKAPAFPTAGAALAAVRAAAEKQGRPDFTNMWSGQAAGLATELSTAELTRRLGEWAGAAQS